MRIKQVFFTLQSYIHTVFNYSSGLGSTVSELNLDKFGVQVIAKTQFSMCVPAVVESIEKNEVNVGLCMVIFLSINNNAPGEGG